ncbi:MAG TPA: hypothetical protein VFM54_14425 [Micromonosporaceae bacterium]|nr:hypothetical protein [Micromonosporaceae bacterium]
MEPGWVAFHRRDTTPVVELVRRVAEARDPGEHGDGVEVVVESPAAGRLADLLGRADSVQARIIVTKVGGEVAYPFDVRLVSEDGAEAARRAGASLVGPGRGWATSETDGEAFLVHKGRPGAGPDWAELTAGTVTALVTLAGEVGDEGWRARVDRAVRRR